MATQKPSTSVIDDGSEAAPGGLSTSKGGPGSHPATSRGRLLLAMLAGVLAGILTAGASVGTSRTAHDTLRKAVAEFPAEDRTEIAESMRQLQASAERDRYVALHRFLNDGNAEVRRATSVYSEWERKQVPEVHEKLISLSPKERIQFIQEELLPKQLVDDAPDSLIERLRVPSDRFADLAALVSQAAKLPPEDRSTSEDARRPFTVMMRSLSVIMGSGDRAGPPHEEQRRNLFTSIQPYAGRILELAGLNRLPLPGGVRDDDRQSFFRTSAAMMVVLNSTVDEGEKIQKRSPVDESDLRDTLESMDPIERGQVMELPPTQFKEALLFRFIRERYAKPNEITVSFMDLKEMRASAGRWTDARGNGPRPGGGRGGDRFGPPRDDFGGGRDREVPRGNRGSERRPPFSRDDR